jgi:hypothetical protein
MIQQQPNRLIDIFHAAHFTRLRARRESIRSGRSDMISHTGANGKPIQSSIGSTIRAAHGI